MEQAMKRWNILSKRVIMIPISHFGIVFDDKIEVMEHLW